MSSEQYAEKENGIEPINEENVSALQKIPQELIGFIEDEAGAKRFLEAAGRFRIMLPKITKPEDWVKFGEQVYLQEQSLLLITNYLQALFQYNITILKPETHQYTFTKKIKIPKEDGTEELQDLEVYEIELEGGLEIEDLKTGKKRRIEPIMGSCSTDDPFFSKKHGQIFDANQISRVNLKKKAHANYRGNCFRLFWGLKGMTIEDLKTAGLDINRVHDSTRRSSTQVITSEDKNTLQQLWERILKAHYGVADDARKWLQQATSYPEYVKKDGKRIPAFHGVTDINRVKMGYGYKKLCDKVEELEKREQNAGEAEAQADNITAQRKSTTSIRKYLSAINNSRNENEVYAAESHFAKDTSLTQDQIMELQTAITDKLHILGVKQ